MELLGLQDTSNTDTKPTSGSAVASMSSHCGERRDLHLRIKHVMNAKERNRNASVNDAFLMLRRLIPTQPLNRKLSKIETLRLATSYIAHLNSVLMTGIPASEQPCQRHFNSSCGGSRPAVCTFCVNEFKRAHQTEKAE